MTLPDEPPAPSPTPPRSVPWRALALYVAVSFGGSWLLSLPLWLGEGLAHPMATPLLAATMLTPAIAALLSARLVERRTWRGTIAALGLWPIGSWRRLAAVSGVGLFGGLFVSAGALALAALLGLVTLDFQEFSGFRAHLEGAVNVDALPLPLRTLGWIQIAAIPINAVFTVPLMLGEELGWRGWLLPALRPLGTWPALLSSGAIWGLWHAPAILLGYNFDEPNLWGVLLMTAGCVALGAWMGWLRLRSGLVWPAAIAHGTINAAPAIGMVLIAAGPEPRTVDYIAVGWAGWIASGVLTLGLVAAGQFAPSRFAPDQLAGQPPDER